MSGWLSLAITVILVAIAYLVLNRSIRTRTSQQVALDEIKREVGAVITELNQTTERNIELIEARISELEKLIQQADGRVRALKHELSSSVVNERYSSSGRKTGDRRVDQSDASSLAERNVPEERTLRARGEESHEEIGYERSAESLRPPEPVPLRQRVRELYLQGIPLDRIASIVGKTIGEIELIVSLEEGSS
jgi:hypothetical protein